jgi:hypothetical protein
MPHRFDKWENGLDSLSEYWADGPVVPRIAAPNLSIGRESPVCREHALRVWHCCPPGGFPGVKLPTLQAIWMILIQ